MKARRVSTKVKWFLIGFGIRILLGLIVTVLALINFEAGMWYLADLPTLLVITLAEEVLPASLFRILGGGDPFYIPLNLLGSFLWGGIFMLLHIAVVKARTLRTTA